MRGDRELVGYVPLAGAATDRDLAGPWHEGGGPRYRRALRGRDSRSIAERVGYAVKRSLRGRSVVHGKRRRRRNCDFMRDGAPIIGDLEPRAKWSELASPAWPVMLPYRNRSLPVLSVMMTQAELWDLRPRGSNPYREVNRFRTRPRERFLSLDELKRLGFMLDHADDAESRDEALGPGGAGAVNLFGEGGLPRVHRPGVALNGAAQITGAGRSAVRLKQCAAPATTRTGMAARKLTRGQRRNLRVLSHFSCRNRINLSTPG